MSYDSTDLDHKRLLALAAKAGAELSAAHIPTRGPRLPSTSVEKVRGGFLKLGSREKLRADDGGSPRFWVVTTHVIDGLGHASGHSYRWSTEGLGVVLTPSGHLCAADGRADSKDTEDWVYSDIRDATDEDLLVMDNHPGRFKAVDPREGERWREVWIRQDVPAAHAKGVGVTVALWSLLGRARAVLPDPR